MVFWGIKEVLGQLALKDGNPSRESRGRSKNSNVLNALSIVETESA